MQGDKCEVCSGTGWVPDGNCPSCGGIGKKLRPKRMGISWRFLAPFLLIICAVVIEYPAMQEIGFILAASGASLNIFGTLVNNLFGRHRLAMKSWGVGNPAMWAWAAGFIAGLWTADLGMYFILAMYSVFWASGWYGLLKYRGRGLP